MDKRAIKISVSTVAMLFMGTDLMADRESVPVKPIREVKVDKPKYHIQNNMMIKYNELPAEVDNMRDLFTEGIFYSRLRSNTFYWDWEHENYETGGKLKDNKNMGLGGSIIYKTAVMKGFSGTFSYYGSLNPEFFRMDDDEVGFSKSGKDTFSRYKVLQTGHYGLFALGQTYLEYNNDTLNLKTGRQFFESVFTASNDTKMIPNTFDGVTVSMHIMPKTKVRAAWFGEQKLRDHEDAHDVITFKNAKGDSWGNNDDAAVHRGLSYNNFIIAGKDTSHDLFIAELQTKYIDNLKFTLSYLQVPGVVKDIVAEAHYKIPFQNGWELKPGVRYFHQMDDGGGAVAGNTNLLGGELTGYSSGVDGSLDSSLIAARVDLYMPEKKGFFRFGYSKIDDKADIVAPWRGFPTGGFTRAMGQYNWFANTETYMVRAVNQLTSDLKVSLRYAIQNFDDKKKYVTADSTIWHLDGWYDFTEKLQMKTRIGLIKYDTGNTEKADLSYNEFRLEFNYLF